MSSFDKDSNFYVISVLQSDNGKFCKIIRLNPCNNKEANKPDLWYNFYKINEGQK